MQAIIINETKSKMQLVIKHVINTGLPNELHIHEYNLHVRIVTIIANRTEIVPPNNFFTVIALWSLLLSSNLLV